MAEREQDAAIVSTDLPAFVHGLRFEQLPDEVLESARRSLLDLIGVAAAGSRTRAAAVANAYAATQLCGSERNARILFDGRRAGLAGAAFAGATTVESVDAHDGHVLTKGHSGVAVLPALLALIDGALPGEAAGEIDGRELMTALVLGYEVATRAGISLHATVSDVHCSGAWSALGCAAIAARLLALDAERTRHALGIAEFFGPRGQIMRSVAWPAMVKDGSGWGAHTGVSAALLALSGFTGAPAVTVEREDAAPLWSDLGARWRIREQYFKAYPVCRWAQPAIETALDLQRKHGFAAEEIVSIVVETFSEAVALGSQCAMPRATDEAQYSLPFSVAAALVFGDVGADEVGEKGLSDPRVERLVAAIKPLEDAEFSRRFPSERWARVRIVLSNGRTLESRAAEARGGAENPLSEIELRQKYRELAEPVLGAERAARIEHAVDKLVSDRTSPSVLVNDLLQPS